MAVEIGEGQRRAPGAAGDASRQVAWKLAQTSPTPMASSPGEAAARWASGTAGRGAEQGGPGGRSRQTSGAAIVTGRGMGAVAETRAFLARCPGGTII